MPVSTGGDLEPVDRLGTRFSLGSGLGLFLGLPRGFPSSGLGVVTLSVDASCDFFGALGASSGLLGLTELFLMPFKSFFFVFNDFLEGLFRGTSSSSDSEDSEEEEEEDDDEGDDDNAGLDLRGVEVVEAAALRAGAPGLVRYIVGYALSQ